MLPTTFRSLADARRRVVAANWVIGREVRAATARGVGSTTTFEPSAGLAALPA